jgi:DNA-binding transcriptional regulator YiaG
MNTRTDVARMRAKLGVSQEEFARRVGVTARTVYRWERGLCWPAAAMNPVLDPLARSLGIRRQQRMVGRTS